MLRRTTCWCILALVLASACSSGGGNDGDKSSPTTTADPKGTWDQHALDELDGVAARIAEAFPGQCKDPGPLPRGQYASTAAALKFEIPLAAIDCTALGETVELSALGTERERAEWVTARTDLLCARAKAGKYDLEGIHYVVSDDWVAQLDTQGSGLELQRALGAKYQPEPCPGHDQLGWEDAALARVSTIRDQLARQPRVKCDNLRLLDWSEYKRNPEYRGEIPAAYERCDAPDGTGMFVAAFSDKSTSRDAWVEVETKSLCGSLSNVQAVVGPDWAVITSQPNIAALAGVATGGEVRPPAC